MAHHWDFGHIVRYNGRLLWLNLMFLLCVGLLPLTTAMLGDHDNSLIWTVYAINMVGIGLMLTAVWSYAATHKLIHPQVEPEVVRYVTLRHLVTPGVFLFSIGLVALSGREIGSYAPLLIPFVYTLLGRFSPGAKPGSESEGEDEERESAMRGLFWQIVTLLPLIAFLAWALWVRLIYSP
jgi:uncharacterized membrane protein